VTYGRGGNQSPWEDEPRYQQGGYGQQYPQEQPWEPPQYDPYAQHDPYTQRGSWLPPQQAPPGRGRERHLARNALVIVGSLVVLIVAYIVAGGGGQSGSANGTGGNANTAVGGNSASKTPTTRIGSAITLSGNDFGEQMTVTVVMVISHAKPGDELTSAPAGDRLYAVQLQLMDTGSVAYSDEPSNGAAVVDSTGQSYPASITDIAAGCQGFSTPENITTGASGLGCVVFDVPKAAKIIEVQFTLDSGTGPQTGQWSVG
jgi:hypothetical protein